MKLNLLCIFGVICLIAFAAARPADEEYDAEYEEEPVAAAPAPKPTRASPLKNRRNPLAGRSSAAKAATTTTTPAPAKVEESEIDEEPLDENLEAAVPTTEPPKKFKAGGVRPFRSNDDLLAALKRRREQAAHNKSAPKAVHQEDESGAAAAAAAAEVTPSPSKNRVNNGRKRFNLHKAAETNVEENVATPATPARAARRFPGRN